MNIAMDGELNTASHGVEGEHHLRTQDDLSESSEISAPDEYPQPDPKPQASSTPHKGSKQCSLCHTPRDVLIRCQIDSTGAWHFICTRKCWKEVSGGVVDGDGSNKWYKYGGMWKNKHEGVSAKIKGVAKKRNKEAAREEGRNVAKLTKARGEMRGEGQDIFVDRDENVESKDDDNDE